jgi:hypothetical protein
MAVTTERLPTGARSLTSATPTSTVEPVTESPLRRLGHMLTAGGRNAGWFATLVILAAAALLIVSGVIHLHLWDTGYSQIPTIGPLFLFQGIAAIVIGAGAALFRRAWLVVPSFAMAVATLGGFLITVNWGLFGFQDTWSAPYATTAFEVEVASGALFGLAAVLLMWRAWRASRSLPTG